MGSEVLREEFLKVTSAAAAVSSRAVRVGGNQFDVVLNGPDALMLVEVSGDKLNWFTATDIGGTPITGLGDTFNAAIQERAKWARLGVAIDAGQPQEFAAQILIHKQGN